MTLGPDFKMTFKTRLCLKLYKFFDRIGRYFISHCDVEKKHVHFFDEVGVCMFCGDTEAEIREEQDKRFCKT